MLPPTRCCPPRISNQRQVKWCVLFQWTFGQHRTENIIASRQFPIAQGNRAYRVVNPKSLSFHPFISIYSFSLHLPSTLLFIIITWLCDILALVWHFGPACVTFRPGLCDILALSCVTKASACHHTPILTNGAVYRKFQRSSVSKTT